MVQMTNVISKPILWCLKLWTPSSMVLFSFWTNDLTSSDFCSWICFNSANEFSTSPDDCDLLTIAFTPLTLSLMALKFELRTLVCSSSLRSVCRQLSPVAFTTSALISSTNVSLDSLSTTELLSLGLAFRFHFSPLIAVSLRVIFRGFGAGRPRPYGCCHGRTHRFAPTVAVAKSTRTRMRNLSCRP